MLKLWSEYTRQAVHQIFSPETTFTVGAGTWGMQGIIKIPNRDNDWIFYVTLGEKHGDYEFDESISESGVLSWQSQPKQKLSSKTIQSLISQNSPADTIHLFIRFKKRSSYTYLGELQYLSHDPKREQPVFFLWQLMDWPIPREIAQKLQLNSLLLNDYAHPVSHPRRDSLREEPIQFRSVTRERETIYSFIPNKNKNYVEQNQQNSKLGSQGELLVLKYEKEYLVSNGRLDLANRVRHVSVCDGDGAGYDIASFSKDGSPRLIEVKTTEGTCNTPFFISPNELDFSEENPDQFVLIRVYEYNHDLNSGKFFSIQGNLKKQLELTPTAFRAVVKRP